MADTAKFEGIKSGGPRFEFGNRAPPKWLMERIEGYRVDGEALVLKGGKRINPGDILTEGNG